MTILFVSIGNNCTGQNSQNDSLIYNGAKSFLLVVLKTLEPQWSNRNEDSICRAFVPKDTLTARLKRSYCNPSGGSLNPNSPAFEDFIYKIDSSCTRKIEKNIFYFRINLANRDPQKYNYQKPYVSGYIWYKVWFDGKKYWLIPGHHSIDVCIDFLWISIPGGMFYYTRELPPWITLEQLSNWKTKKK